MLEKINQLYNQYIEEKYNLIFNGKNNQITRIGFQKYNCNYNIDSDKNVGLCNFKIWGPYKDKLYVDDKFITLLYLDQNKPEKVYRIGNIFIMINNDSIRVFFKDEHFNNDYDIGGELKKNCNCIVNGGYRKSSCGLIAIKNDDMFDKNANKWNFINHKLRLISSEWFDEVGQFKDGYAPVMRNNTINVINTNGELIFKEWILNQNKIKNFKVIGQKFIINNEVYFGEMNLNGYQVDKKRNGYECRNNNYTFFIKYNPLVFYGNRHVLCENNNQYYLYDRINNSYLRIGKIEQINFDSNFIYNKLTKEVYLIYEDQIIDITEYYNQNLINKKEISISDGVKKIISKEEFGIMNINEIEKLLQEEKINNQKIRDKQEKIEQFRKLNDAQKKALAEEEKRRNDVLNALKSIQESLEVLKQNKDVSLSNVKLNIENVFVKNNDHLEIIPLIIDMLKYIDLSLFKFDNVKVSGIDFRNCNININPQTVYNKDMKNCNLEGVHVSPFMNFSGVDIRGTKFGDNDNPSSLSIFNPTFKDSIYDETTTYNGISFIKLLDSSNDLDEENQNSK